MASPEFLYVVVAVCIAWPLNTAMLFHQLEGIYSDPRSSLGEAVISGAFASLMWPVGIFMVWCLTGFAQHGIWRQK